MSYLYFLFALNFLVELLLLLGTNRLTGFPPELGRVVLGAMLCGIHAAACLAPGFSFLGSALWRWCRFFLTVILVFGLGRSALSRGAVYLLLCLALEGIATGAGEGKEAALLFWSGVVYLLCRAGFGGAREYVGVELTYRGATHSILALRDTGNLLRDPLTGEGVLVAGADVGSRILGLPEGAFRDPVEVLTKVPGLRLIPYQTIGQGGSMMPALRFRNARIGGGRRDVLVAFAPEVIGRGEGYQMLTGGAL